MSAGASPWKPFGLPTPVCSLGAEGPAHGAAWRTGRRVPMAAQRRVPESCQNTKCKEQSEAASIDQLQTHLFMENVKFQERIYPRRWAEGPNVRTR